MEMMISSGGLDYWTAGAVDLTVTPVARHDARAVAEDDWSLKLKDESLWSVEVWASIAPLRRLECVALRQRARIDAGSGDKLSFRWAGPSIQRRMMDGQPRHVQLDKQLQNLHVDDATLNSFPSASLSLAVLGVALEASRIVSLRRRLFLAQAFEPVR